MVGFYLPILLAFHFQRFCVCRGPGLLNRRLGTEEEEYEEELLIIFGVLADIFGRIRAQSGYLFHFIAYNRVLMVWLFSRTRRGTFLVKRNRLQLT